MAGYAPALNYVRNAYVRNAATGEQSWKPIVLYVPIGARGKFAALDPHYEAILTLERVAAGGTSILKVTLTERPL